MGKRQDSISADGPVQPGFRQIVIIESRIVIDSRPSQESLCIQNLGDSRHVGLVALFVHPQVLFTLYYCFPRRWDVLFGIF